MSKEFGSGSFKEDRNNIGKMGDLFSDMFGVNQEGPELDGNSPGSFVVDRDDFRFYELDGGTYNLNDSVFTQAVNKYGIPADKVKDLRHLAGSANMAESNNDPEIAEEYWLELEEYVKENRLKEEELEKDNAQVIVPFGKDFDINNPEKEVGEYSDAAERYKKAIDKREPLEVEYNRLSKRLEKLADEHDAAEKAGDKVRVEEIEKEAAEVAERMEAIEPKLDEARKEVELAKKSLEKEEIEAKVASDKDFKETGNSKNKDAFDGIARSLSDYQNRYNELNEMAQESEKNLRSAEEKFKNSLSKAENELSNVGRQGMSAANAAMDPNGAGGTRVLEAGIVGGIALAKAGKDSVKTLINFFKKRSAKSNLSDISEKMSSLFDDAKEHGVSIERKGGYVAKKAEPEEPEQDGPELS